MHRVLTDTGADGLGPDTRRIQNLLDKYSGYSNFNESTSNYSTSEEEDYILAKALVFLAPGFEEIEAVTVVDILRRCNIDVTVAGLNRDVVEGSHGIKIVPDRYIDEVAIDDFDVVICPGGAPGYENLRKDKRVLAMIGDAYRSGRLVAAICASPAVLSDAGILRDRDCTIYPGMEEELKKGGGRPREDIVVVDGRIITSRGPATAIPFALAVAERLVEKRVVESVRKATLADLALK